MSFKYQVGDKVCVKSLPCGAEEDVAIGDIATVIEVDEDDLESHLNTREAVIEEIQNTQRKLDELHEILKTFE